MLVEAGHQVQCFAAACAEQFVPFSTDFVKRFQAVAGEAWAGGQQAAYALVSQAREDLFGIGFEPGLLAKTRLETGGPVIFA